MSGFSLIRAWREIAWVAGGQAIGAVGAIVGVRLLTMLLDPSDYGEFALGLTLAVLLSQTLLGPLSSASERFFAPSREAGRTLGYFAALARLTAGASGLILGGVLFLSLGLLLAGLAPWVPLAVSAVLFALFSGWEGMLDAVQNAARHRALVAWHQGLRQWIRPCMAFVLLTAIGSSGVAALAAYALASLLVLGSQAWFFRRGVRRLAPLAGGDFEMRVVRGQMVAYATPFGMWGLFTWVQISSDRWALQVLGSSQAVGLYAIVLQLGFYPINLIATLLIQLAAPIVFAQAGEGTDMARTNSATRLCAQLAVGMLAVTLLLAAVTSVMHEVIFAVLVGQQYRSVSFLLPLAILGGGLFNVGQMLSLVPMALGATRALLAPKIGTAVLAVVLNLMGAYLFGTTGVLVAGLLFAIFYLTWVALLGRTLVKGQAKCRQDGILVGNPR